MSKILAIDCGNTNLKWALFRDARADDTVVSVAPILLQSGNFVTAQISEHLPLLVASLMQSLSTAIPLKVVISNVAGKVAAEEIKRAFHNQAAPITFIESHATACGMRNGYTKPHTLGVDRFAALVAAHQQAQNQLVVMAGTAITIDALDETGEFLGGLIVPGLHTMRQALHLHTAQLPNIAIDKDLLCALPKATDSAIASGAMQACVGAVAMQAHTFSQVLRAQDKKLKRIVIAGGGATAMLPQLNVAIDAIFSRSDGNAPNLCQIWRQQASSFHLI